MHDVVHRVEVKKEKIIEFSFFSSKKDWLDWEWIFTSSQKLFFLKRTLKFFFLNKISKTFFSLSFPFRPFCLLLLKYFVTWLFCVWEHPDLITNWPNENLANRLEEGRRIEIKFTFQLWKLVIKELTLAWNSWQHKYQLSPSFRGRTGRVLASQARGRMRKSLSQN